jgi:hypothetical protein
MRIEGEFGRVLKGRVRESDTVKSLKGTFETVTLPREMHVGGIRYEC